MGVPSASCELFVCVKEEDEQLGQAMRKAEKTLANRLAISLSQLFFFIGYIYKQVIKDNVIISCMSLFVLPFTLRTPACSLLLAQVNDN